MAEPARAPSPPRSRPGRWLPALRIGFLAAVLVFAWLGLRGRFDEVGDALAETPLLGLLGALVLVLVGLFATGLLWWRLMSCLSARIPFRDAMATFFVGQLGKYIPGSVWSIGAQADLARRHDVPARSTVGAGLLFLGYHVATAVILGAITILTGALDPSWPDWLTWLALVGAVLGLLPAVVRFLARRVSGREAALGWIDTAVVIALMTVAWAAYSLALVLLTPGQPWGDLAELGGAFAAAYAVGVMIIFAPAGVGAREAVFVLLLTPTLEVGPATALALAARVVHTVADAAMAGGTWWIARRGSARS